MGSRLMGSFIKWDQFFKVSKTCLALVKSVKQSVCPVNVISRLLESVCLGPKVIPFCSAHCITYLKMMLKMTKYLKNLIENTMVVKTLATDAMFFCVFNFCCK
jgi:hypothetical protein